ncbi:capsular associated protein [Mortierella alpina]|nr:capsular associated protein [Mortierella alpina]
MAVSYTPLNQHPSPTASRRGSGDLESHADDCSAEKPFRMTLRQRQLVGLLAFVWLLCLYVALKFMEAAQASHHSPLLLSTNALLQTTDLYHTLTLPLLQLSNRTELISSRCGSNTLAPHLLSFLSNNLNSDLHPQDANISPPTSAASRQWSTEKYLFAMVLKNSENILPDLLTRVMEIISILGPEHCHLSIVDHASTDGTPAVLDLFISFLESYNGGAFQESGAEGKEGKEARRATEQEPKATRRQGHISYTIRTLAASDLSLESSATIKNLAIEPLVGKSSTAAMTLSAEYAGSIRTNSDIRKQMTGQKVQEESPFDNIILLEPVVTCAEDILELVFQSRLQNADLTCGMDLHLDGKASDSKLLRIKHEEAYDNSATRDILGRRPHNEVDHRDVFSTDPETQTRFEKRLPFQVQSCWSSAVVLRLSPLVLSALPFSTGAPAQDAVSSEPHSLQEPGPEVNRGCDDSDERMVLSDKLWKQPLTQQQQQQPAKSQSDHVARVVVVPAVHFASSAHEYMLQGLFNGWGLWPSTAQQYRDALEAKFVAMSRHPLYGYRPSTSSYGYIPRVKEEKGQIETDVTLEGEVGVVKDEKSSKLKGAEVEGVSSNEDGNRSPLLIPEEVLPLLKAQLEDINAVFGVRDIEDAVLTKQEAELIVEWRDRSRQGAEC